MKRTILSLSFLLIAGLVFSQQDPQFSQNMFNKLANNPGYAGSNQAICATILHRSQWIGFDGAPKTLNLSVDAGIPAIHGGVGLNIVKDAIGPGDGLSMLGLQLTYAYRTDLGAGQLGAGFSLGMLQSGLDGSALNPADPDPSVPQGGVNGSKMDFGLGVYYNTQDVYIGLSSSHLTAPKIEWSNGNQFQTARHYFLIAGYAHELNPMFTLNPSIYLKSDGSIQQLDINTNVLYNNKLWGGVSYRLDEGLIALLGMHITDNLKFGLAYDVVMSEIQNNSLEFMLGYCFQVSYDRPMKSYKNPRFL
jgi:type IX secretion system PorP/SprF family membrane protein